MNSSLERHIDIQAAKTTNTTISVLLHEGFIDEMLPLSCPVFTYVFEFEPVLVDTFTDCEPVNANIHALDHSDVMNTELIPCLNIQTGHE